jgi:hypothetical protein
MAAAANGRDHARTLNPLDPARVEDERPCGMRPPRAQQVSLNHVILPLHGTGLGGNHFAGKHLTEAFRNRSGLLSAPAGGGRDGDDLRRLGRRIR